MVTLLITSVLRDVDLSAWQGPAVEAVRHHGPRVTRWDEYDLQAVQRHLDSDGEEIFAYGCRFRIKSPGLCDLCGRHLLFNITFSVTYRLKEPWRRVCTDLSFFDKSQHICHPCHLVEEWSETCKRVYLEEHHHECPPQLLQQHLRIQQDNRRAYLLKCLREDYPVETQLPLL